MTNKEMAKQVEMAQLDARYYGVGFYSVGQNAANEAVVQRHSPLAVWRDAGEPSKWTVDPTRRAAARAADLTPADCGPGVGGTASEPLYEECLAMQGPPEIEVTDEMRRLGGQAYISAVKCSNIEAATIIYRAMAAVAPVELYRADERKIDALTEQRDAWAGIATRQDARLAALEVENTTLRTRAGERDASALQALRRRVTSWPLVALAAVCLTLSACSTPVTTMRNPQTGAVATCGGGVGGSILGGVAGYNIEQSLDQNCQAQLLAGGFERVR